jgi:CRP/FNR family cyclic AMP-dependent transcriptional regulator
METTYNTMSGCRSQLNRGSEFFNKLTPAALQDLKSMEFPSSYGANVVLFSEKDPVEGIAIVLEGEVKMSINSSEGRRLSLSIARKGEILGLASVLSGSPHDTTAETLFPSKVAFIARRDFLNFLARHPEANQAVMEELSRYVTRACEQLRTVGLSATAPEKLARLLLDWSEGGQTTECGTRFRFSMTHEEIGEFIGASRETVTRTLSHFKTRQLVAFQGSMLTIPSRTALASFAHSY